MQEGSQNVITSKSTSRLSKQKIIDHSKQSVENVCFCGPHDSQLDFEILHYHFIWFDSTSYVQEMIERVTPDGLPPEWIKEIRIQKKASGTRKDTV